jgi:hypothetical protein
MGDVCGSVVDVKIEGTIYFRLTLSNHVGP